MDAQEYLRLKALGALTLSRTEDGFSIHTSETVTDDRAFPSDWITQLQAQVDACDEAVATAQTRKAAIQELIADLRDLT